MMYTSTSQASRRRDIEAAEKIILECDTEEAALQYLYDSKPSYLRCGYEQWIDNREVKENLKDMRTKLKIHGYVDRAERFQYLCTILATKWEAKPTSFKILMKFLIEMSQRPTEVLSLTLGSEIYSDEPDVYFESEDDEEAPQEQLKQIILDEMREDFVDVHYSSDSDLSDWKLSDAEEEEIVNCTEKSKFQHSHTVSSSNYTDNSKLLKNSKNSKKELELFWAKETVNAEKYLKLQIRKIELTPLNCQPVISSLVTLFSKFGEFWEWRKQALLSTKSPLYTIFEDNVICELLWQFATPNATNSVIFTPDWKPKTHILISSMSRLSFQSLLNKYGLLLQKLTTLLKFKYFVENSSSDQPKMFTLYAQCISEIIGFISSRTDEVLLNRKIKTSATYEELSPQPCTTLVQLNIQLKDILNMITALECFHTSTVTKFDVGGVQSHPAWFSSIKLISSLEMHLNMETRPMLYGLTLFLFSKSLLAFLDSLFGPLETLIWVESNYLFKRNPNVTLNDSNFWDMSIQCQPVHEKLNKEGDGIRPLSCLDNLLPKMLSIIKILEMLRLLGEDFTVVLGELPSPQKIVDEFLKEFLPPEFSTVELKNQTSLSNDSGPDYLTHIKFLGLEDSFVADSFKYIMDKETSYDLNQRDLTDKRHSLRLERFLALINLPIKTPGKILSTVLVKTLDPYFKATRNSLRQIFSEHKMDEIVILFREIVLGGREDFAQAVIKLANSLHGNKLSDEKCKDSSYQRLLETYYPEGRENFDILFLLNPTSSLGFKIIVTPYFPLNLILSSKSIDAYLFVARQLHRIRKCLWSLNSLDMKENKTIETTEPIRMLLLRFALIHLCSSLRTFLLLKIFSKDLSISISNDHENLDSFLKAHETFLCGIEGEVLQSRALDTIVISKLISMSSSLSKHWTTGLSLMAIIKMEDTLKKCWRFLGNYSAGHYSREYNELAYHVGLPPEYL